MRDDFWSGWNPRRFPFRNSEAVASASLSWSLEVHSATAATSRVVVVTPKATTISATESASAGASASSAATSERFGVKIVSGPLEDCLIEIIESHAVISIERNESGGDALAELQCPLVVVTNFFKFFTSLQVRVVSEKCSDLQSGLSVNLLLRSEEFEGVSDGFVPGFQTSGEFIIELLLVHGSFVANLAKKSGIGDFLVIVSLG